MPLTPVSPQAGHPVTLMQGQNCKAGVASSFNSLWCTCVQFYCRKGRRWGAATRSRMKRAEDQHLATIYTSCIQTWLMNGKCPTTVCHVQGSATASHF